MTTWKDPDKYSPTKRVQYWVMRDDFKPFKAWYYYGFWVNKIKAPCVILDGIVRYAEIEHPPVPENLIEKKSAFQEWISKQPSACRHTKHFCNMLKACHNNAVNSILELSETISSSRGVVIPVSEIEKLREP